MLARRLVGARRVRLSLAALACASCASRLVVAAWASCDADSTCDNGEASFLEAVKTLQFLEQHPRTAPIDFSLGYSASGHSTGARVVLMLAAIVDSPAYLATTKYAPALTPGVRASLSKIRAVVADHADPMYDQTQKPDLDNWNVTKMPVMIVTGTEDYLEPELSGWRDFKLLRTKDKVYVNIANATHLQPISQTVVDGCKRLSVVSASKPQ